MSDEEWEQETMRKDTDRMLLRLADNPAKAPEPLEYTKYKVQHGTAFIPPVPAQVGEPKCPKCEFEQKPCPGGAHAFALWEDGIRTVEDYAKMLAAQPVSAPSPEIPDAPLPDKCEEHPWAPFISNGTKGWICYSCWDKQLLEEAESALRVAREERRKPRCFDCNSVGMSHCAHPEECGGVYWPDSMYRGLESALRAAREERDRPTKDEAMEMLEGIADRDGDCTCSQCAELVAAYLRRVEYPSAARIVVALEAALAREREARKQEAVEQFNAGIEAAAKVAEQWQERLPHDYRTGIRKLVWQEVSGYILCGIRALAKSVSGSPERLEEKP